MDLHDILRRRRMVRLRIVVGDTVGRGAPDPAWSARTSRATQRRRGLDESVRWNTW